MILIAKPHNYPSLIFLCPLPPITLYFLNTTPDSQKIKEYHKINT